MVLSIFLPSQNRDHKQRSPRPTKTPVSSSKCIPLASFLKVLPKPPPSASKDGPKKIEEAPSVDSKGRETGKATTVKEMETGMETEMGKVEASKVSEVTGRNEDAEESEGQGHMPMEIYEAEVSSLRFFFPAFMTFTLSFLG